MQCVEPQQLLEEPRTGIVLALVLYNFVHTLNSYPDALKPWPLKKA